MNLIVRALAVAGVAAAVGTACERKFTYACEQYVACAREQSGQPAQTVEECARKWDRIYSTSSAPDQRRLEAAFLGCHDAVGCAFVDCSLAARGIAAREGGN